MFAESNCCRHNVRYFQFVIAVSGLAAFICTCMKSAAVFMTSERCVSYLTSALLILHCIFIILQLVFLLLNINGLFSIYGYMHKIAIMHLVATNVALWFNMALMESSNDWQQSIHLRHNSSLSWSHKDLNITIHSLESDVDSSDPSKHFPNHAIHVTSHCWWRVPDDEVSDIVSVQLCLQNSSLGFIWKTSSEILYPVIMQYYFIVPFLLCIIWESTTIQYKKQNVYMFMVVYENLSFYFNSGKGFCLGIILFFASISVTFAYGVLGNENFSFICMIIMCIIYGLAVCASVIGLIQLKYIYTNMVLVNQNLFHHYQPVGMLFVYVFGALNIISGSFSGVKYIFFLSVVTLLMILHTICQHFLIILVSSATIQYQAGVKSKQVITFLVLCNMTLWILESFIYGKHADMYSQFAIYGSLVWPITIRIIVPCLVFFRFNSAMMLLENLKFSHTVSSKGTF